jgi:hypothetical protein
MPLKDSPAPAKKAAIALGTLKRQNSSKSWVSGLKSTEGEIILRPKNGLIKKIIMLPVIKIAILRPVLISTPQE